MDYSEKRAALVMAENSSRAGVALELKASFVISHYKDSIYVRKVGEPCD